MLQSQIVLLRILVISMIGVIMFISLLFVDDLFQKTRPLKRKTKWRQESRKDRRNMITLLLGIVLFLIGAFIFQLIKLILRGEL